MPDDKGLRGLVGEWRITGDIGCADRLQPFLERLEKLLAWLPHDGNSHEAGVNETGCQYCVLRSILHGEQP